MRQFIPTTQIFSRGLPNRAASRFPPLLGKHRSAIMPRMREPFKNQPDPFDNPFCAAAGFACDPHATWELYKARHAPQRDYSPFQKEWDKFWAQMPPPPYRR
jgi:hypothetical protein